MVVASAIACGALTMGAAAASGKEPRRGFKGPFTPIDFPGAPRTIAGGINDQGKIVGAYANPNPAPSVARTGSQPPTPAPWRV
jgi:hypothetical protein